MDDILVSFPLKSIFAEEPLPGDLYLFVSGHFIKYKSKDDSVSKEKLENFYLRKLQYVFVTQEDLPKFQAWGTEKVKQETKALVEAVGDQETVKIDTEIRSSVMDLFTKEFEEEEIQEVAMKTRRFIDRISNNKMVDAGLARLRKYSQSVADHSVNVANLSIFLGQHLGYTHQLILENIYIGALLHDIGKTRIDPKHFENIDSDSYKNAMKVHPKLGKNVLRAFTTLPQEVTQIVEHHHERHDGTGYPQGLKGGRIYDLAKIVSIANVFDNQVANGKGEILDRQVQALKVLENDRGSQFDPKKLQKCVKILKKVLIPTWS